MATEVGCKNLKSAQNESIVESTDSEERSETSVEVKAQVMKRGDAGWVPIDGGGLSVVGLSTFPVDDNLEEVQYRVNARRVKDNASLLSCILKKDLAYTKGNPLFHHWQTQGQKFGLTFHSSTDASTFEHWICNAKQNLLGSTSNCEKSDRACEDSLSRDAILAARLVKDTVSLPGSRARTPSPGAINRVTMRHSSIFLSSYISSYPALHDVRPREASSRRTAPCTMPGKRKSRLYRQSGDDGNSSVWIRREDLSVPEFSGSAVPDNSYVQFSKSENAKANCNNFNIVHEYFYPNLESIETTSKRTSYPELHDRRRRRLLPSGSFAGTSGSFVGTSGTRAVPCDVETLGGGGGSTVRLPKKGKKRKKSKSHQKPLQREYFSVGSSASKATSSGNLRRLRPHARRRCSRCGEFYVESDNRNGKCPYGSDRCVRCVELVTCATCARALLYHVASDENGEYGRVCSCSDGHSRNARKWLVLTLLSIFLPCFWCYAPLDACRRCCVKRGNCGSRHKSE